MEDFVGRTATNLKTINEPGSHMGIDLGPDRFFMPTCYTIRNRNSLSHVLMNWEFQVSNDKVNWCTLDQRNYMTGDNDIDA